MKDIGYASYFQDDPIDLGEFYGKEIQGLELQFYNSLTIVQLEKMRLLAQEFKAAVKLCENIMVYSQLKRKELSYPKINNRKIRIRNAKKKRERKLKRKK